MSTSNRGRLLSLVAWAGLLALLFPLTLTATAPAAFLTVDPSEPTPHALSRPADASSRHQAQVDTTTLLSHDRVLLITHLGDELELRRRGIQHRGSNEFTWHGRVYQQQRHVGSATFTVQGQRIVGRIGTRDGRLRVQGDPGSNYWLDHIDPDSIPQRHPSHEREDLLRDAPSNKPDALVTTTGVTTAASASADDESARVDVIAYYTNAAIEQYTDEASMRLSIRNTIDMANTALIDSEVDHRFRLIGIIHWNHEEGEQMVDSLFGLSQDDTVANLRNLYSADLNTGFGVYDDFCGLAFSVREYDANWNFAYSINNLANDYPCLEIQVVAHEMGHNLGLHHDPDNAPPPGDIIEPFAYGHLSENEFNTIMSYHPGCGGGEYFNCFGSDFFSNPNVIDPDSGLAVGIAQERDNAEVLRRTMPLGAGWRQPPSSLASAAGLPDMPFRTEGHSPWVAQDQVPFDGRAALVSGPVHGEEESRLVMSLDNLGIFDRVPRESIQFSVRNGSADTSDGSLTVLADGIEIARLDDFSSEWTRHSFSLPDEAEVITWVWQSDKRPSTEDGLGVIYLANTRLEFGSGSGGGCTLGAGQTADASWLLLLLLSLLMKWRPYSAVSRQSASTP